MLTETLASRQNSGLTNSFSASSCFDALPPAGRFPLASIDTADLSQVFFSPQMDVRLSLIPEDELPALLDDSMSLPPVDLTLSADAYADISLFALISVPRAGFAAAIAKLPAVPLRTTLPQVLSYRQPLQLLNLYEGTAALAAASPTADNAWQSAIAGQTLGYFIRRRSAPTFVSFTT